MTSIITEESVDSNVEKFSLFKNSRYKKWFIADTATEITTGLNSLAFPLLALHCTGSSASAGTLVAFSSVGSLLGLLPGGVIADKYNRRKMNIIFSIVAIASYLLVIIYLQNRWDLKFVLATLFAIVSFSTAILAPVFTASLKQLVPRSKFAQAMGANEARSALLALAVPPLSGFLIGLSGILPILVSVVCLITSILSFPAVPSGAEMRSSRIVRPGEFFSGFSIILGNKILKTLVLSGMLINVAVSVVMLVLIFSFNKANVDPVNIGFAQTGIAVGAMVGAVLSGYLSSRVKSGLLIIISLLWVLICLLLLVFSADILTTAIFAALAVVPGPVLNATLIGYTLTVIPESQQGRSDAALSLIASGAAPFAPLIAGVGTASLPGNLPILVSMTLILIAICLCVASPEIRSLQRGTEWAVAENKN